MSEEANKTISMQVPAELLSEIAKLGEQVKEPERTGDGALVSLSASPEQLKTLTALRSDMESHQRSQIDEWHSQADRFIKVSEMRISFYERLILLAGGSFALSLTFLSLLHRHALQGTPAPFIPCVTVQPVPCSQKVQHRLWCRSN